MIKGQNWSNYVFWSVLFHLGFRLTNEPLYDANLSFAHFIVVSLLDGSMYPNSSCNQLYIEAQTEL